VLTQVDVQNSHGDTLSLQLLDASNGFVVKEITGLDPVNATLTTSVMAQRDGAQAQNARRETRNITMKIGLEPDFVLTTVDSLRQSLYAYFMPKSNVGLKFYKDTVLYAVGSGQIESFENALFSSDPEVDISIICYDPDLYAPAAVTTSLGTVSTTDTHTFGYEGTTEAGVIFALSIDRTMTDFTLYNTAPDNSVQSFIISGSFVAGDVVTINSIPGQKGVTLTRGGIDSSILYWMDTASTWITLFQGNNLFRAFAEGASIPYSLTYTTKYGGI
jgi:hypothetical protein